MNTEVVITEVVITEVVITEMVKERVGTLCE
jgi:hypothetical protein